MEDSLPRGLRRIYMGKYLQGFRPLVLIQPQQLPGVFVFPTDSVNYLFKERNLRFKIEKFVFILTRLLCISV